jgi:hypothetical protein
MLVHYFRFNTFTNFFYNLQFHLSAKCITLTTKNKYRAKKLNKSNTYIIVLCSKRRYFTGEKSEKFNSIEKCFSTLRQ